MMHIGVDTPASILNSSELIRLVYLFGSVPMKCMREISYGRL